ncbi:MAG: hypothetical protein F6K23_21300 [Okeania sp. SIO2C9]|uniref:hypothetical protein n=1 Tax=Okeania sp. SIO2C9 TaxID=2607791 RepID=UPI0013BFC4AC|nr:hypothetical protein [Okeania sp. SIO2C9]NEQ75363.1 hypothetical protein [Okeania sp. SIO2C9]
MKEQLEQRLQKLKNEFASGKKMIADLKAKQKNLHQTLLRIQGAIQVLEEEITKIEEDDFAETLDFSKNKVESLKNLVQPIHQTIAQEQSSTNKLTSKNSPQG